MTLLRQVFNLTDEIDRWLRSRYPSTSPQPRVFWTHIMAVTGMILLKNEEIPVTARNLEQYARSSRSSLYRTIDMFEEYGIVKKNTNDEYELLDPPKKILAFGDIQPTGIDSEFIQQVVTASMTEMKQDMLASIDAALNGIVSVDDKAKITKRLATVKPKKLKELSEIDKLIGEGGFM